MYCGVRQPFGVGRIGTYSRVSRPNSFQVQAFRGQNGIFENRELLIGDMISMATFCMYKQISSIVMLPNFPGWLAPLQFNPMRLVEFACFLSTMCATWAASTVLFGGYTRSTSVELSPMLRATWLTWLMSLPVMAAQLALVTAVEGGTLVGDEGFAQHLPLAATGVGEPFVTAAGVLGTMAIWRAFYVTHLDRYGFLKLNFKQKRLEEMSTFIQALKYVTMLAIMYSIALEIANTFVGEEQAEALVGYLGEMFGFQGL
eukprot:TRINITY_DN3622_c0_g1_i5.p3 TRINITY_DN3622_c0_g1~~TRINITY_DN3622_c0_g1_i5.p3  ORF type:complete len:258 (-),score=30.13 TRINITY_DN3622_c0_g1_i5:200-973(-)